MRVQIMAIGVLLLVSAAGQAATFDQLVGAVTPSGDAYLVKQFRVPRGSVVAGVQFYSNDLRTTFPEVGLFRGPATKLSEATALVQLRDVRPVGRHLAVAACTPLRITSDQDLYVAVRLPVSDGIRSLGDGAGIAARRHDGPPTSYFVTGRDGVFGAMDVDYGIELVFQTLGKATADGDAPEATMLRTFLEAKSPTSIDGTTDIEFGLERMQAVSIIIYDVSGRRISTLVQETLGPGAHLRRWDGRDEQGNSVAAGIYLLKFEAAERSLTDKLVLMR